MPSKSPQQAKLMRAVAHNPEFAQKVGIPQSVGEEFAQADQDGPAGPEESAANEHAAPHPMVHIQVSSGGEGVGHSTPHMPMHQSPMQSPQHPTAGKEMPMTRALMGKKK